jgi:hypothetical protein
MRYIISDNFGDDIEIVRDGTDVNISITGSDVALNAEQFKDFRRAVGYVWTEIEGADK